MLLSKSVVFQSFLILSVAAFAQDPRKDVEIGAEAAKAVIATRGLYEKPDLTAFYRKLGARLVQGLGNQPFTYSFEITDEIEPNAYALPGGFLFATRNLFVIANSEDELAGVLGHEIIHSHQRHSTKAARRSILPAVLAIPGGVAGMFSQEAGSVLTAPSSLLVAKRSRKDESEADELGVRLAAAAGYDPTALDRCLNRITKTMEIFYGEKEKSSYFNDHPTTPERTESIAKIAAAAQRGPAQPVLAGGGRDAFLRMLDGLVIGRNPEQGIFNKSVFVHPDLNFRMEMPEGWKDFNTPAAFGAMDPKGKGQLVVGLGEPGKSPEEAARETIARFKEKAKKEPAEQRAVDVNGQPGYYALYTEKKSNLHMLWVEMDKKLFRIVAAGDSRWNDAMRASVLSLRKLTPRERAEVRVLRLRIVPARAGETLQAFSARTGNTFKPEMTGTLNDLDPAKPLSQGQLLKIGRIEPYK